MSSTQAAVATVRREQRTISSDLGRFSTISDAAAWLGRSGSLLQELEKHHAYSGRHSLRVANLASECARELCLSPQRRVEVVRCALLHDVGKCDIPLSLLDGNNPDPSAEEWRTLQSHSAAGARRVAAKEAPGAETSACVRAVHERIDGSGYPDGLRGSAIPLSARIVAACDAYEAMTCSERHYKSAYTVSDTQSRLRELSGSSFDAAVVASLRRVIVREQAAGRLSALLLHP